MSTILHQLDLKSRLHVETVEGHPGSSIGLSQGTTSGQGFGTIEYADVIEDEEASLEHIVSTLILSIYPPRTIVLSRLISLRVV